VDARSAAPPDGGHLRPDQRVAPVDVLNIAIDAKGGGICEEPSGSGHIVQEFHAGLIRHWESSMSRTSGRAAPVTAKEMGNRPRRPLLHIQPSARRRPTAAWLGNNHCSTLRASLMRRPSGSLRVRHEATSTRASTAKGNRPPAVPARPTPPIATRSRALRAAT